MNSSQVTLMIPGIYLLLGVIVIWIRWNFGLLRLMAESMASQFGVPRDKVRLAAAIYVVLWPMFFRGLFTDRKYINRAKDRWRQNPPRCECGGSFALLNSSIRRMIATGSFDMKCECCGRAESMRMNITWTDE